MDIKDLQEERERMIQDFIQAMNDWLEEFNGYADKLIEEREGKEQYHKGEPQLTPEQEREIELCNCPNWMEHQPQCKYIARKDRP
jgi:hypothetical protein